MTGRNALAVRSMSPPRMFPPRPMQAKGLGLIATEAFGYQPKIPKSPSSLEPRRLEAIMPRALLSASFSEDLLLRQTPGRLGRWGDWQYSTRTGEGPVDAWVVVDNLREPQEQVCPPSNTLLITGEPESLRRYRRRFTGQFGQVWTSHASIRHDFVFHQNEAQHWHYGLKTGAVHRQPLDFDDLVALPRPRKSKTISVICSSKADTEDHRQRIEFVRLLKANLGDAIDVFGRGTRDMDDKSEAIYDYKYHIVLENDHSQCFMTEKLPDAFLGWSYPIYFGGPEANFRYPEGSFARIDIYKPEEALAMIRSVVATQAYERSHAAIAEAREAVLYRNNLFAMLDEYWKTNLRRMPARNVTLVPKHHRASLVLKQLSRVVRKPFAREAA